MLSRNAVLALIDLIENKLSAMHIGDREDLREAAQLRQCLIELKGLHAPDAALLKSYTDMPRRGRRRKLCTLLDSREESLIRQGA